MTPIYNQRAPLMWAIIAPCVDVAGRTVVDLGCGYGDLLLRTAVAGAREVLGVEGDPRIAMITHERIRQAGYGDRVLVTEEDLDAWAAGFPARWDVGFCCSVLPYLREPRGFLRAMAAACTVGVVECQYAGDGPGPDFLRSDDDMRALLAAAGWTTIRAIGKTHVTAGRDCWRTIWRCE